MARSKEPKDPHSVPKKKLQKWFETYPGEPKVFRGDIRLTAKGRDYIEAQSFAASVVFERLARGIWKLSGPDLDDDDFDE
jgi:hypothetical protein